MMTKRDAYTDGSAQPLRLGTSVAALQALATRSRADQVPGGSY